MKLLSHEEGFFTGDETLRRDFFFRFGVVFHMERWKVYIFFLFSVMSHVPTSKETPKPRSSSAFEESTEGKAVPNTHGELTRNPQDENIDYSSLFQRKPPRISRKPVKLSDSTEGVTLSSIRLFLNRNFWHWVFLQHPQVFFIFLLRVRWTLPENKEFFPTELFSFWVSLFPPKITWETHKTKLVTFFLRRLPGFSSFVLNRKLFFFNKKIIGSTLINTFSIWKGFFHSKRKDLLSFSSQEGNVFYTVFHLKDLYFATLLHFFWNDSAFLHTNEIDFIGGVPRPTL